MSFEPLNWLALSAGLALFLGFSLPLNACLRQERKPAFLLGLYLLVYAEIVLIAEIASLIHALNLGTFLLIAAVLSLAAIAVWYRRGRPALLGPFQGFRLHLPSFRANGPLWLLAIGITILFLATAVLILATPPNTYDSMTYHLSRVGYWMQHQSFEPWPTPNTRQTVSQMNAEIGLLWTILLSGSDRLAGFVQWFAAWASALSIIGMARLLGASPRQSIFAGLIPLTFPMIFLQSGTTQNDLLAASFVAGALYLLLLGIRQRRFAPLLLSSIGVGLALGTKATVGVALPGFILSVLLLAVQSIPGIQPGRLGNAPQGLHHRRIIFHWADLWRWGLACVFSFVLLGGFIFYQNVRYYGDPLGYSKLVANVSTKNAPAVRAKQQILSSLVLSGCQWLDFSGTPEPLATTLTQYKARLVNHWVDRLGLVLLPGRPATSQALPEIFWYAAPDEDTSWFGILGAILMIAAFPTAIWKAFALRRLDVLFPVIFAAAFLLTFLFFQPWTPYIGRYFVLPVIAYAPSFAWLYTEKPGWRWLPYGVVLAGLVIAATTLLSNVARPLVGPRSIWGMDALTVRTIKVPELRTVFQTIQARVPGNAVLATRLGGDDWDYPLFGSSFMRVVIPVDPARDSFAINDLTSQGVQYFLVSPTGRNFLGLPDGLRLLEYLPNDWLLFEVSGEPAMPVSETEQRYLFGLADDTGLFQLSDRWKGKVGLTQLKPAAPWSIETPQGVPHFWLGSGEREALVVSLWSDLSEETPAVLTLHLIPGPSRPDPHRTLVVLNKHRRMGVLVDSSTQRMAFDSESILDVPLTIKPGSNEAWISILEAPTLESVNGDARSLMAMLRSIRLGPVDQQP